MVAFTWLEIIAMTTRSVTTNTMRMIATLRDITTSTMIARMQTAKSAGELRLNSIHQMMTLTAVTVIAIATVIVTIITTADIENTVIEDIIIEKDEKEHRNAYINRFVVCCT